MAKYINIQIKQRKQVKNKRDVVYLRYKITGGSEHGSELSQRSRCLPDKIPENIAMRNSKFQNPLSQNSCI